MYAEPLGLTFCGRLCYKQTHFLPSYFFSDDFVAAAAAANVVTSTNNDNNKISNNKSCDPDTCSISTNIPCTKGGSRTSSHISIPGLDWDSQVRFYQKVGTFYLCHINLKKYILLYSVTCRQLWNILIFFW